MKPLYSIFALALLVFNQAAAWTETRDFNFGNAGASAISSTSGFNDLAGSSIISTQANNKPTLEGFSSAELSIRKDETGFGAWGGEIHFPAAVRKGEELWIQLFLYIPNDFVVKSNTGHLKFLRMRNVTPSVDSIEATGHLDTLIQNDGSERGTFSVLKEGQSSVKHIGDPSSRPIRRDHWIKVEQYVYLDDVPESLGGNGVVRLWMDNVLVGEVNDIPTITDAATYYSRMLLFTYWNGNSPKDQTLYLDYVTITNERPSTQDEDGNYILGDVLPRPKYAN